MIKKYKLVQMTENGQTVTRIKALRDGGHFKKGDIGGIVDASSSLSQSDDGWLDYGSMLSESTITGDVFIKDSCIIKSSFINVHGRIEKSYLSKAMLSGADVSISNSAFKGLHGNLTVYLQAKSAKFEHSAVLSGKVHLFEVSMETNGDDLPVALGDVTIQKSKFDAPVTVTDSFLYNSVFSGVMRLENSMINNSTVKSTGGAHPVLAAPVIKCFMLVGSKVAIHDGRNFNLTTGICISDVECSDLSKVTMMMTDTYTVVRIPESKWFVHFTPVNRQVTTEFDTLKALSSSELYDLLENARGEKLGDALELARICILLACNEPSNNIRKKLKKLRLKLMFRKIWEYIRR